MRKLVFILFGLIIPILALARTYSLSEKFDFSDFNFTEIEINKSTFIIPQFGGLECYSETGSPMLPTKCIKIALPFDASEITVENINLSEPIEKTLDFIIAPAPTETPYESIWGEPEYIKDSKYPKEQVEIVHIENYKGLYKLAYIHVYPVAYDPDKNYLRLFENITFSVRYEAKKDPLSNEMLTSNYVGSFYYKEDLNTIRRMVENPEMIVEYEDSDLRGSEYTICPTALPAYEYTIITSEELAPSFQRLVALKRIHGLNAGIICVNDILSNPEYSAGDTISNINDDAGKIKAYLYANKDSIRYVLLGGKPPIVPIRYGYMDVPETYEKYIPTDLYYGTGVGTNWDHNNNGIYGERYNGFSYSTIFNVGRLLCTSIEDINNYIDKLEIYELNPGFGDHSYLQNAFSHYSDSMQGVGYQNLIDSVSSRFSHIFANFNLSKCVSPNIHTGSDVVSAINSSNVYFLNLHGHGNPGNLTTTDFTNPSYGIDAIAGETIYTQIEDGNNGLNKISNFGYPGICYNCGCTTTPFDSPRYQGYGVYDDVYDNLTCNMGESYTLGKNYGGVAYLGNSRLGYRGNSLNVQKSFLDYLINTGNRLTLSIADAENYGRIANNNNVFESHYGRLSHNIIGDPSVEVWRTPNGQLRSLSATTSFVNGTLCVSLGAPIRSGEIFIATAVEPDGSMSRIFVPNQNFTIPGASNNCVVYVHSPNCLPYVGNVEIPRAKVINKSNYIYANNVLLGTNNTNPMDGVVFMSGVNYVYDAKGNVVIDKNVCVVDNSTLTIYTPGTCQFPNGVNIQSGSKIILYCDNVEDMRNIATEIEDGRVEIYTYDKYGITPNVSSLKPVNTNTQDTYYPLLEDGKTWTYRLIRYAAAPNFPVTGPLEVELVYWTEANTTEDGEIIYKMHQCIEDLDHHPIDMIAYLTENIEEKKVMLVGGDVNFFNYDRSYLSPLCILYDFVTLENSSIWNAADFVVTDTIEMELCDGIHKAFMLRSESYGDYAIVEGIGIVGISELSNRFSFDFFSACLSIGFQWKLPYLYKVTGGDGRLIYLNPEYEEGCTSVAKITEETSVVMHEGEIDVTGADANEALLYNMQGQCVVTQSLVNGTGSISTKHIPAGIYIISVGTTTQKVFVK